MRKKLVKLLRQPKIIFFNLILNRNGPAWYVNDTCGRISAFLTWILIFYGQFVCFYIIFPPWVMSDFNKQEQLNALSIETKDLNQALNAKYNIFLLQEQKSYTKQTTLFSSPFIACLNAILFLTLSINAFISHCRAMFSNPGTTELDNASPDSIAKLNLPTGYVVYKCTKCVAIKPQRAHHCSVCRRCINKMDHHCPWINNCVGEKNQKFFVLFTFYIWLTSSHALCLVIHRFITCANIGWSNKICTLSRPGVAIGNLIGLTFEAALFSLFTAIMFGTQVYSICTDLTGIEQLKGDNQHKVNGKNSKWLNFKSVFGDKFSIKWLLPFFEPQWAKQDMSLYCV